MIIPCPHCQTKLNLPENVEGKQVRCPSCKEVFRATREVLEESVQPGLPESAPTSVKRKPAVDEDDEDRPRKKPLARYKGYEEEDDDDDQDRDPLTRRDFERETKEIIEAGKARARPAGYFMLAAFLFTTINIVGNAILSILTNMEMGGAQGGPGAPDPTFLMAATVLCLVIIFGPMLIFVMLGGKSLLTLGSRGLIITAVVMNILLLLLLGGGLALNIVVLASGQVPVPLYLILPTVVMNSISCVCNLGAAALAIRVLVLADVSEAYAAQSGEMRRRY